MHRLTPAQLRALAHPLRFRIVELLRQGPSTASRIAEEVGESTGSTSYHLRALAKSGLIEEVAGRGNGRERWWRRPEEALWIPTDADDPETRAAQAGLRGVLLERDEEAAQRYLAHESELDPQMRAAAFVGGWHAWATPEQIDELAQRVFDLVNDLRGPPEERADGARQVYITFRAVPWLE